MSRTTRFINSTIGRRLSSPRRSRRRCACNGRLLLEPLEAKILLAADVTTDQDDYAPGETAIITATDFQVGETVEFLVLHNDGTPNTGGGHEPWQVTDGSADDLDGLADGNILTTWYVNPDDSGNSSFDLAAVGLSSGRLASATFTDSDALSITVDTGGPDDEPSQSDLNSMGFDTSHLGEADPFYSISINYDDTDYPGGNTGDACALLDSDGDGLADFAYCVQIGDADADGTVDYLGTFLYDCKDTNDNRCFTTGGGGDGSSGIIAQSDPTDTDGDGIPDDAFTLVVEQDIPGKYTAGDTLQSGSTLFIEDLSDPFAPDALPPSDPLNMHDSFSDCNDSSAGLVAPSCLVTDTVITANIFVAELVELDGDMFMETTLTNVCTFPSPNANSDDKDCVVNPGSGFLKIVKNVADGDPDATFTYNLDGTPFESITTVDGTGETNSIPLAGGVDYTLEEILPDDSWGIVSAVCDNGTPTDDTDDVDLMATDGVFTLDPGERETCTFVNELVLVAPDISVVKLAGDAADGDAFNIDEPGGEVTYTVQVTNNAPTPTGDATLDSLSDDIYGNITLVQGDITSTTCSVPQPLLGGGATYECTFTATVSGNAGEMVTDVVTATASNDAASVQAMDDAKVTLTDVLPPPGGLSIVKSVTSASSLPEPGGDFDFQVVVTNESTVDTVTVTDLDDTFLADLQTSGSCEDENADTVAPYELSPGESLTCTFTVNHMGQPQTFDDIVTVTATDDDGADVGGDSNEVTVEITDVDAVPLSIVKSVTSAPSLPEPGGDFDFQVVVTNESTVDNATVTDLDDTFLADLQDNGTCSDEDADTAAPWTLSPGESLTCTFTVNHMGQPQTFDNIVTVAATDDDGADVGGVSNEVTVEITDAPAVPLSIVKSVTSAPSLPEPGGDFDFQVVVTNESTVDTVTVTDLDDTFLADLQTSGSCEDENADTTVPYELSPGESLTCTFTVSHTGQPASFDDIVTVAATDDDGANVGGVSNEVTVFIFDIVPPAEDIDIEKTATPTSVPEPGANVTFTVEITNNFSEPLDLDSLTDSVHGDLNGRGDCSVPQTIAIGGTYSCSFEAFVGGNAGYMETDIVTASLSDDDGNSVEVMDSATVTITDVPSEIEIMKTADPTTVIVPGQDVTFTFTVNNLSVADEVTIETLIDSIYGDLNGVGNCIVPQTIAAGGSYSCSFTEFVGGDVGDSHTNVVTVTGTDDDDNPVEDDDDETVTVVPVPNQGCTPGFWKNNARNKDWVAWPETITVMGESIEIDPFVTTVGDLGLEFTTTEMDLQGADTTLVDALSARGGGENALMRHTVAAILNTANSLVNYPLIVDGMVVAATVDGIVALVNAALDGGDIQATKNMLAANNELGCSINQFGDPRAPGDVDADADVDLTDMTLIIINYTGSEGTLPEISADELGLPDSTFSRGDFDGDQDVDVADFTNAVINFTGADGGAAAAEMAAAAANTPQRTPRAPLPAAAAPKTAAAVDAVLATVNGSDTRLSSQQLESPRFRVAEPKPRAEDLLRLDNTQGVYRSRYQGLNRTSTPRQEQTPDESESSFADLADHLYAAL